MRGKMEQSHGSLQLEISTNGRLEVPLNEREVKDQVLQLLDTKDHREVTNSIAPGHPQVWNTFQG